MEQISRRAFLRDLGRGTLAVAIVGVGAAACADSTSERVDHGEDNDEPTTTSPNATTTPPSTEASTTTVPPTQNAGTASEISWERVDLGFVSAYVLVNGSEAAVVDTGVSGSESEILDVLETVGLGWGNVGHVILTHLHGDHIGSLGAVMDAATQADGYAGADDIPRIGSPRPLTAVGDGDQVMGLEVIETPGHTAGHISVFDPAGSVLVAGDALNGGGSGVTGANARFTADMDRANASARKMAALMPNTVLFGHGEPVLSGAAQLLEELVADV